MVAPAAIYGGSYSFLRNVASRFGVETDFVDLTDLDQVRAALRPATRVVYAETLANPTTAVADLPALAEIAGTRRARCSWWTPRWPRRWSAGRWSTARTWCCTRRPSTSAGIPTSPAAW